MRALTASALMACGWTVWVAAQQPAADPRFSAKTELVLLDVTVLDRSGVPVDDLSADRFSVEVAGRPRRVVSAQFIGITSGGSGVTSSPAEAIATTSNSLPTSGRALVIVVDETHLRIGANQAVLRAAEQLLGALAIGDPVAVVRWPRGDGVEFTTDRARVVEALRRVAGTPPPSPLAGTRVALSEASDFSQGARSEWPRAVTRECGDPRDPTFQACRRRMELQARVLLVEETMKARASLEHLRNLFGAFERTTAPVTVALIAESLFIDEDPSMLAGLSEAAARARATLHVVRPLGAGVSMADTMFSNASDEALREAGLQALASQLGGRFVRVSGTGASAFASLAREMSGYYLLGLESSPDDLRGRPQRLRVRVARPGVTVRVRPMLSPATSTTGDGPEDRLRDTLHALLPVADLPVTISTRVVPIPFSTRVRLLVAGEVGAVETRAPPSHVGYVVRAESGAIVTSYAARIAVAAEPSATPAPFVFTTGVELDPGDFELRFAAIDEHGKVGSVHHAVRARVDQVNPLLTQTGLGQAIDELRRAAPTTSVLDSFVDQARDGRFGPPPEVESRPTGDVAMVTFVAGLSALRDGRMTVARALFTQTKRAAPAFEGLDRFLALTR